MTYFRRLLILPVAMAATIATGPATRAAPPSPAALAPPADTRAATVHLALQLIRTDSTTAITNTALATAATPAATIAPPATPTVTTLASPTMLTLDGSTASIAVTGGDFAYNISLSPTISANGKLLILWNIRLSGKSLPGATGVSATGAVRIDVGKTAGIAEVSLTDPTTGRMSTFRLQGVATTAVETPAPVAVVPASAAESKAR